MDFSQRIMERSFCINEFGKLKKVILCEPKHMTIRDVINDTQKKFKDVGIHIEKAMKQHKEFVRKLEDHGIEVILLPPARKFPEQVFTRDIGFTLGQTIFVADMANRVRQGEEDILKDWLKGEEVSYYNIVGDPIEGGDVMINDGTIYVGLSDRTTEASIEHLESLLPKFKVIAIPFKEKYLHLDCVFNIISPTEALIYPEALTKRDIELFASQFDLIEVTKEEQFTLGTNVLSIGDKKIFSLPVNEKVNQALRAKGFEVIEVDITEIIKSGGSFRCCTMPLIRGE
ncbi:MAG: dimethylarginine dimethylaminohydrolase family protein [Anaerobacillus sp.]|uniref:dimethylarginine dimethylaminohydrolase family protein n=1 Tax=Anaerobacillus sp. TaxID=1872506 RepID=UPI00391897F9